jgi:hypothetical protein
MWYFTVVWLIIGTAVNFLDWVTYFDEASFFALLLAGPTIIWLFNISK